MPKLVIDDLFDDAFTAIARDGAGVVEVAIRLQKAFGALAETDDKATVAAARKHSRMALARAEKSHVPPGRYRNDPRGGCLLSRIARHLWNPGSKIAANVFSFTKHTFMNVYFAACESRLSIRATRDRPIRKPEMLSMFIYFHPGLRHAVLATALTLLLIGCSTEDESQAFPPAPVRYITVAPEFDVTIEEEYAGRLRGSREVEVRSRVEGILLERLYNEGQRVAEGDELFLIDPPTV